MTPEWLKIPPIGVSEKYGLLWNSIGKPVKYKLKIKNEFIKSGKASSKVESKKSQLDLSKFDSIKEMKFDPQNFVKVNNYGDEPFTPSALDKRELAFNSPNQGSEMSEGSKEYRKAKYDGKGSIF